MAVPLFDVEGPRAALRDELRAALSGVLESGHYVRGEQVAAFEREFARHCGAAHAIGVGNGTDALTLALRALDVGPGDEVVVPSFTFYASAEAIGPTGARAVFCDIDPQTYCVTAEAVRAALTPRTKAVIAVHLFGNVAPIEEIAALGVPVIEDAAQAAGAIAPDGRRPGALGTLATFSFYPSKNLGCLGDGGAVTTNDDGLAEKVRMLAFHGSRDKQTHELIGVNSRLDEVQAAVLRVQLPHLEQWSDGRRTAAGHYEAAGLGELVSLPQVCSAGTRPAWHLYVVASERADELSSALDAAQIGNRGYYRRPTHSQPAMAEWAQGGPPLPGTDQAARTHLALPMSPLLTREQADEVVAAVSRTLG